MPKKFQVSSCFFKNLNYFCNLFEKGVQLSRFTEKSGPYKQKHHSFYKKYWEFSSVGSEHLPYKQRVTGSNPVTPTN